MVTWLVRRCTCEIRRGNRIKLNSISGQCASGPSLRISVGSRKRRLVCGLGISLRTEIPLANARFNGEPRAPSPKARPRALLEPMGITSISHFAVFCTPITSKKTHPASLFACGFRFFFGGFEVCVIEYQTWQCFHNSLFPCAFVIFPLRSRSSCCSCCCGVIGGLTPGGK